MRLTLLLSLTTLALPAFSAPLEAKRQSGAPDVATITRLAPPLGFNAGLNPTGTGDCDGAVNDASGKPIKVPCACPPTPDVYIPALIKNVQAGFAVNNPSVKLSFPTGDSKQDKSARITAASITIQNLNGSGKGCPIASTKLGALQKAVNDGTDVTTSTSPPASSTPATAANKTTTISSTTPSSTPANANKTTISSSTTPSPTPSNSGNSTGGLDAATIKSLAPELGFQSGINPTGTGDCDGAVNGPNGKPIKIPCACPPPQNVYLDALVKNVQAGKAVNNPTVGVSFPTDNSKQSQSTRITAALITLQNLNGPGKGCPAVSTTLQAKQKALFA